MGLSLLGIVLLKAIERVTEFFKNIGSSKKVVKLKDNIANKELASMIIRGDVNAPVNVNVIVQGDKYAFSGNESDLIQKALGSPEKGELVKSEFAEEYKEYQLKDAKIKYKFNFVNDLDAKYKALVKLSEYIISLYNKGDMDIAEQKKTELDRGIPKGRHFCNLYSVGYIPQLFSHINKIGLSDKATIQQLIEHTTNYSGVAFVNQWNSSAERLISQCCERMRANTKYMAVHGLGTAGSMAKNIGTELRANADFNGLLTTNGYTFKETPGSPKKGYAFFIFNEEGATIWGDFTQGKFKGFA